MRAQPRPGKRARINLLCRMHACRWTLFVREKNSVVKAQRVRFVVLFFIIMFFFVRTTRATRLSHQSVFLSFFFFSIVEDFLEEEEEEKQIMNGKGEIVGKRILVVFSRRHPPH